MCMWRVRDAVMPPTMLYLRGDRRNDQKDTVMADQGFSAHDLARARAETPGCREVLHLNNAGAALMPQPVLTAQIDHLQAEALGGGYEAADAAEADLARTYDLAAQLIGASRDEIALVEHATRAWDLAFYSIPFQRGDRILTSRAEYAANTIAFLQLARRHDLQIEVIPADASGQLDVAALAAMIDARTRLIAVTHVPTNGGLVNPAEQIGRIARAAGVLYLLDACQSVGQLDLDVQRIGCDFLSATGRKYLRGPRGTGFLYVRRDRLEQLEPPMLDLHGAAWIARDRYQLRPDARRFENWEYNVAARRGLAAALDYALAWGLPRIEARVTALAEQFRTMLQAIPGVTVQDLGDRRCGIVTFTVAGRRAAAVAAALRAQRINVTDSTVFGTRYDMEARGLDAVVRASVHYYNTDEELERCCSTLSRIIG
jgi:cysteine desulfurase/selenocysteine lyase